MTRSRPLSAESQRMLHPIATVETSAPHSAKKAVTPFGTDQDYHSRAAFLDVRLIAKIISVLRRDRDRKEPVRTSTHSTSRQGLRLSIQEFLHPRDPDPPASSPGFAARWTAPLDGSPDSVSA